LAYRKNFALDIEDREVHLIGGVFEDPQGGGLFRQGQGFGFSLLVTRPHSECTYDGKKVVTVDIAESVSSSGLVAAWLKRAPLTKPAQLFVEFGKAQLGEGSR